MIMEEAVIKYFIDKFYHGEIFFRDGTWQAHLNGKTILTGDDIVILSDIIDQSR
jgi:hypothetical protein